MAVAPSPRASAVSAPWGPVPFVALFAGWFALAWARPAFELWPGVTTWYPPAALIAAACIVWGGQALVPILAAAMVVALVGAQPGEPLWRLALMSASLKLLYWAGARILKALRFDPALSSPWHVVLFAGAMATSALGAASLGSLHAMALGPTAHASHIPAPLAFWLGDIAAVLALTPALLVGIRHFAPGATRTPIPLDRTALLQLASVPLVLWLTFGLAPHLGFFAYGVCFVPLGWVALTRGVRGAALMNAALDVGAVVMLHYAGVPPRETLEVQVFIATLALTGLLLGSVADDREHARELLVESEERYRQLVELMPDPLVVHAEGRVLFANEAAAQALGASNAAALAGIELAAMADPASRDLVVRRVDQLAEGESVELVEHRFWKLDGSGPVDLESVSTPFAYDGQHAALTVARDVTVRKRLAEELRQAQRMEAVGRLAGGVAHDFNNLLTIISSYSQLLLGTLAADDPRRADAGEIRQAADRGAALTRQLLAFSRKQNLRPTPIALADVVAKTETLLTRLIGAEIAIVFRPDEAGIVLADRGQLEQVIVNLAVNARDAMPDGGVLTIETGTYTCDGADRRWRGLEAGTHAMLVVRDTGSGMSDEVRAHIFDPFFTTKDVNKGTGLGLATVYGIVQQSGGEIYVESAPRLGSMFTVFLPHAPAGTTGTIAPNVDAPVARGDALARRATVLLAEDDAPVRAGVRRMLEARGHTVVEAEHGRDALAKYDAAGDRIDLVLSDIAMPEMDGREFARQLRQRYGAVKIILVSGYAGPDFGRSGADGVTMLQKPLDAEMLCAAIDRALT